MVKENVKRILLSLFLKIAFNTLNYHLLKIYIEFFGKKVVENNETKFNIYKMLGPK